MIKKYELTDKPHLLSLFTDDEVMKYVGDGVMTMTQAEDWWRKLFAKFYPEKNLKIWAVFAKENNAYVGHAGIYPRPEKPEEWELVYFLSRENWGKGYATEIARRIINYGFEELKLMEIYATVNDDHSGSIRVLEKVGMRFKRFEFDDDGSFSVYSISAKR